MRRIYFNPDLPTRFKEYLRAILLQVISKAYRDEEEDARKEVNQKYSV